MATVYLNKRVRFKCPCGNAVYFQPLSGDSKVTINGADILLDDCKLKLVGPIRPGQCPFTINPATNSPPGMCASPVLSGSWQGTGHIIVSRSKHPLIAGSSIQCSKQGVIKPFRPTYKTVTVNSSVSRISVQIGTPNISSRIPDCGFNPIPISPTPDMSIKRCQTGIDPSPSVTVSARTEAGSLEAANKETAIAGSLSDQYLLCPKNWDEKCKDCAYRRASHTPREIDESKNARILEDNMQTADFLSRYAKDSGAIMALTYGTDQHYSVAHHHLIPVNQCFKEHYALVKLANYYGYDINNALNGICLPTAKQEYTKETRFDISFRAMEYLGMQWHMGGHRYSFDIPQNVDNILIRKALEGFCDYQKSVNTLLDALCNKLTQENVCRVDNFEYGARVFCQQMDHICERVAQKLTKFKLSPKLSYNYYVSKLAFYYAFYDDLREYQDKLFPKRGDTYDIL